MRTHKERWTENFRYAEVKHNELFIIIVRGDGLEANPFYKHGGAAHPAS